MSYPRTPCARTSKLTSRMICARRVCDRERGRWKPRTWVTLTWLERVATVCLCLSISVACEPAATNTEPQGVRLVTLGGAVTEIAFALGVGGDVVGVDTSSSYPRDVTQLPTVGSHRRVSAESVIALRPTHVLASSETPTVAIEQIRAVGIRVTVIDDVNTASGVPGRIQAVGTALGREIEGRELAVHVAAELGQTSAQRPSNPEAERPRVLFIYARGPNALSVAGVKTSADEMIRLAGGRNAIDAFSGFRPLSAEAIITARPDVLLMMSSGVDSLNGDDSVFELPGLSLTPAGRARRLVSMNGLLLLGFGPRTADAVRVLRARIEYAFRPKSGPGAAVTHSIRRTFAWNDADCIESRVRGNTRDSIASCAACRARQTSAKESRNGCIR